jgi:peptide deformylase
MTSQSDLIDSSIIACDITKIITCKLYLAKKCIDVSPEQATKILLKLEEALKYYPSGIGVAANQIGIPANISLIIINGIRTQLINPNIISYEDEILHKNEGCLSIPGKTFHVKRFNHFTIKNNVLENNSFREQTEYYFVDDREKAVFDLTCYAVQHEIDHLNGIMINDTGKSIIINQVGRNDICPCGSNKKYKKCCGAA